MHELKKGENLDFVHEILVKLSIILVVNQDSLSLIKTTAILDVCGIYATRSEFYIDTINEFIDL